MAIVLIDYRHKLPRANWSIGWRVGGPTSITLHYNGPPVIRDPYDQLVIDAQYHIGPYLRADGLQYHICVMPDGAILQTRDLNAKLWHCANQHGNNSSLAIHLPIGGAQQPSDAQWNSTEAVFEWAMARWGIQQSQVYGHFEWPRLDGRAQSDCPGPHLKRRLLAWREDLTGRYEVIDPTGANVRQAPTTASGIATVYPKGYWFYADSISRGQVIGNDTVWLHSADGQGFVHRSVVRKV